MIARILTVSDRVSRGEAHDRSGPAAQAFLEMMGFETTVTVVPDGIEPVREALLTFVEEDAEIVVTTGGTGFAPRDLTPEATSSVIQRPAPGLAEAIRRAGPDDNPHVKLSRGVAGIAESTLIVNLPGSVRAVEESLEAIADALPHALSLLRSRPSDHD